MPQPFEMALQEDGVVYMRLIGSLDSTNFEILKVQVENAKKLVKEESEKQGKKLPILFDLTDFTGTYNVGAMLAMKGLEEHNRPFSLKTAVYGGSAAAQVAAELTLELIGRDNLKLFKTKEEALAWLKEN
jgi:hypothetical protein